MNGAQPLGDFLKDVLKHCIENDTKELSLDVVIPYEGKKLALSFDLTLVTVEEVKE